MKLMIFRVFNANSVSLGLFSHFFGTRPHRKNKKLTSARSTVFSFKNNLSVTSHSRTALKALKVCSRHQLLWIKVMAEYSKIATTAHTHYLCEAGFSAVPATKTKLRSRLSISNTLQVSLSPLSLI